MTTKTKTYGAGLLIFLGWLMYTTSYLGKVNYSANITQIVDFYNITKAQAGLPPTFFFFAYGIGQVFNGIFCKKYNIKWMIFLSLVVSAVINLVIGLSSDFGMVKWLWMVNGFVLSVLWPTLIRLMSDSLPTKDLGRSSVVLGTTVASGTIVIYGLSSIYAIFSQFKLAFYTAFAAETIVAFVWLSLYNKGVKMAKSQRIEEDFAQAKAVYEKEKQKKKKLGKGFFVSVCILCFCAVGVNLIKDGLATWVPSILKEEYNMSDSLSILLTLFLPVVAIIANAFAIKMHRKIPDYVAQCGIVFAMIGVFTGLIIGSLDLKWVVLMLFCLIATKFLASSLNSLITSIYPMFMRDKVNSGLYAGVLNGFCYLGSTMSSYGLGLIADSFGWIAVFWTLIGFAIAICAVCGLYFLIKSFLLKKNDIA